MATFDKAYEYTVTGYEGGIADNPKDPGGLTNKGISFRFLKESVPNKYCKADEASIREFLLHLTEIQAKNIYLLEFWQDEFANIKSQDIANYLFDMCVNHGKKTGIEIAQEAIETYMNLPHVFADGIFGPETLKYLNMGLPGILLDHIKAQRLYFYMKVIAKRPSSVVFGLGWSKRALGMKL